MKSQLTVIWSWNNNASSQRSTLIRVRRLNSLQLTATLVSFLKYSSINDNSTAFPKYSMTTSWQNAALSNNVDVSETTKNKRFDCFLSSIIAYASALCRIFWRKVETGIWIVPNRMSRSNWFLKWTLHVARRRELITKELQYTRKVWVPKIKTRQS